MGTHFFAREFRRLVSCVLWKKEDTMHDDVIGLARGLVAIPSETTGSNVRICDFLSTLA